MVSVPELLERQNCLDSGARFPGGVHLLNSEIYFMRYFRFLKVALVALLCVLISSCEKKTQEFVYADVVWNGSYPVQMQNGTTNEMEDHTAVISLTFINNLQDCIVETGIEGLLAMNRTQYKVDWSGLGHSNFVLYQTAANQVILCYSGQIGATKMTLDILSCDKVERTVELLKDDK